MNAERKKQRGNKEGREERRGRKGRKRQKGILSIENRKDIKMHRDFVKKQEN